MLTVLIVISSTLGLTYFFLLRYYQVQWNYQPEFEAEISAKVAFISVIIVARNEEEKLPECLQSIAANNYPVDKYEIILVDDHSFDKSVERAQSLNISNLKIINLADAVGDNETLNSFKKVAQRIAVSRAKGDVLLFTDADVVVPEEWISTMSAFLKKHNLHMATGTVKYTIDRNRTIEVFQALDIAGTMLMTGAGIISKKWFLANGANMIVDKAAYLDIGLDHGHASGDDVFLMQAFAKSDTNSVGFVKSVYACVTTYPERTLGELFQQRLRWATKTGSYKKVWLRSKLFLIFLFNICLLLLLIASSFFKTKFIYLFTFLFVLKIIAEYRLLGKAIEYFSLPIHKVSLPLMSIIQWMYLIIIGTSALLFKRFRWKGRKVR